jgi:hypothetical protein
LVLALFLAAGFAVVWGVLGGWVLTVSEHTGGTEERSQRLVFCHPDNTPVIEQHDQQGGVQYRNLDGNPAVVPESGNGHRSLATTCPALLRAEGRTESGEVSWDERVRAFVDGGSPAVFWYFVCDGRPEGSAYFVGYDSRTRNRVGFLGTAGFRDGPLRTEELIPFAGKATTDRVLCTQPGGPPTSHPRPGVAGRAPRGSLSTWDVYVVGRDGKVYHADLHARTVDEIVDDTELRSAALVMGVADPIRGTPFYLGVRSAGAVSVLDERGALLKRYPIPPALRERTFSFALTRAGEGMMCWHSPQDSLARHVDWQFCWVSPLGDIREAKITLAWTGWARGLPSLGGVLVPSPFILGGVVGTIRPAELLDEGLESSATAALVRALREFWPALVIAQVIACGLAVLCYRRQVRYGADNVERVVWPLVVLLLGLPGWIGYRFGRKWPVLESCPACGSETPRDREECASCAAEFPGPAHTGIEVFA